MCICTGQWFRQLAGHSVNGFLKPKEGKAEAESNGQKQVDGTGRLVRNRQHRTPTSLVGEAVFTAAAWSSSHAKAAFT